MGAGGGYSEQVKTENTQSAKICLNFNFQGGGEGTVSKSKLKIILKVPRSALISILGGEGALWSEIPERGCLENLDTNVLFEVSVQKPACASQTVSHILRMWRQMTLTTTISSFFFLKWSQRKNANRFVIGYCIYNDIFFLSEYQWKEGQDEKSYRRSPAFHLTTQ